MTNLGLMQLAIESMLKQKDDVAKELLEAHHCAALSNVYAIFDEAEDMAKALERDRGCPTSYLRLVLKAIRALEEGFTTLIPGDTGGVPFFLAITRLQAPHESRCSIAVIANDPKLLAYHRSSAEPPKVKFETAHELCDASYSKLCDEGLWAVVYAGVIKATQTDMRSGTLHCIP